MSFYTINFNSQCKNIVKQIFVKGPRLPMPIQAPLWTEFLICPICTKEFAENKLPISLGCGHTICKSCLGTLLRTQCPYDQTNITIDINILPINYALLQLVSSPPNIEREINPLITKNLTPDELTCYETATQCIERLAVLLKPNGSISGILSRPMQRKLVTLISCQLFDNEGRTRSLRAARSLGERVVTELILQHQNPQQLSQNLWAAVRARGCQFLGPAMQEEVLKLVLLALEDGNDLSRKILVLYVVQKLKTTFPQASKTSIGHVVQLLYRASCFIVSKRESDSSLMTLKEEFRTYEALRREHDTQIVQIATEAGLRIAPDQWSALLYGDNNHKSHMQSIIDKQQSPLSFALSVNELVMALQRTGDPANLTRLRAHMDHLAAIDPSIDTNAVVPTWQECCNALKAVKCVVFGLIDFIQNHGNRKITETSHLTNTSRYKVSFCREFKTRGHCARGNNCNFAHSEQELEKFRTKFKKNTSRAVDTTASHNNNVNPMRDLTNYAVTNGPNGKVNMMNHHSSYSKGETNSQRYNKPMAYRSENSLTPNHHHHNHLKPTNVYSNASSTSTPNLSMQLSPNLQKTNNSNGPRFAFNGNNGNVNTGYQVCEIDQSKNNMPPFVKNLNINRPPLSAPPVAQHQYNHNNNYARSPDFSKKQQLSPYNQSVNHQKHHLSPVGINQFQNNSNNHGNFNNSSGYYSASPYFPFNSSRNNSVSDDFHTSFGDHQKYPQWKQQKSPINMMPKTPTTSQHMSKSSNTSPSFRYNNNNDFSPNQDFKRGINNTIRLPMNITSSMMYQQQPQPLQIQNNLQGSDEIDGSLWMQSSPSLKSSSYVLSSPVTSTISNMSKDKFIRSDSILTSNTDDSYDNLPNPNGRYGAIGIKKETAEWSGLQQTIANRFENNFDIASGDTIKQSNAINSVNLSPSSNSGNSDQNILNGNFLNMQIGENTSTISSSSSSTQSHSLWSTSQSEARNKWNQEFDNFGNDQIAMSLFDIINE
ncbi:hypothetical protein PVAND_007373 [Polypedilum vanderplanki]|uniref:RING-type E3 ubiquitin transferase n=1 Tax=Polypedilum vanderplanki TaxID=319348 RepID=A0A9J6C703_POLVA|nr:hypothetical protein PVAND_007373 [Polypedilum vanderplanki]